METERPHRKIIWQRIGVGALILITTLYLVFSIVAPNKKRKSLAVDSVLQEQLVQPFDRETLSLLKEKDLLTARLSLSAGDSIGLVLNLSDSLIGIELKGVNLHSTGIQKFVFSKFFLTLDPFEYSALLGKPIVIDKQRATIEKVPVSIIEAPKDSAEAALTVFVPDTVPSRHVHLTLLLENGLRIMLVDDHAGRVNRFFRKIAERTEEAIISLWSLISLKTPDYHPAIRLYLPGEEITIIYRALPNHGRVVIRV